MPLDDAGLDAALATIFASNNTAASARDQLATAIKNYVKSATVTVTIPTTAAGAGLQRNPEDSADCLAPSSTKTLTGTLS